MAIGSQYMGECDLRLVHAPTFDGKQDLTIHVRTTIRYEYSYIEATAIQIGNDTLEVDSWGGYALNDVEDAILNSRAKRVLRNGNLVSNNLGGYDIFHTQMSQKKHVFDVILGPGENVTFSNMKDMVSVKINHNEHFVNVVGVLGHFDGSMLARDGVTDLHDGINTMGQEWQVHGDEPMLFRTAREPQYPNKCRLPDLGKKESRRLGEGIGEAEAKVACAHLQPDAQAFASCVYDVTATNDLDYANS